MRSIRRILREQDLVIGLSVWHSCHPWLAKIYMDAGADFVFADHEHIFFNGADFASFAFSCQLLGLPLIAKCPYLDRGFITQLLDSGVNGIQLPMTESADQISQLGQWMKYPPDGIRAAGPGIANSGYEAVDWREWMARSNEETTVIAHIENIAGIEHAEEILAVPSVDVVFIGMVDLSISLGHPQHYDHPDVVRTVLELIDTAHRHGKVVAMGASSYETAETWIRKGVRLFETTSEVQFIMQGASRLLRSFPMRGSHQEIGMGSP
jgi:2-keto-3-deoxy-L-rhamnonate aldolase RhmA